MIRAAAAAALLLGAVAGVRPLAAQEPDRWTVEGEVGASLFFGNRSQATVSTRASVQLADSVRELDLGGIFGYGEATDEAGDDFVIKRSWTVGLSYDHHPFERWSPFVFGQLESSYEKRIELRYNAGVGAKYSFVQSDLSRADLSVALLAERTNPADVVEEEPELLARWSARLRGRREIGAGRLILTTESFWRPRFQEVDDFTFVTTNSVSFSVTERVSLKLTFLDSYDSEAEARGARSNNDGQLLFSVLSSF